jgi:branched-chain amino acid transport system substrate-binding protein
MSGPLGPVGNLVLQGEKVWIAAHPGATIGGKSIQVFVVDDLGTANGGASAARQLVDQDNVQAVIGPFDSDATSGSLPIFNKAGIIDVPLTAYQPAHTPSQYPYSFPVQYSDADSSALAVAGSRAVHSTKIGLLSTNDALGTQLQAGITSYVAKQSGIKIVSSQQYPANPTDLSTQAEKLQAAGADSIIMNSLSESDYTVLFRALSSLNYKVPVIGGSPAADPRLLKTIPSAYQNELWVTSIDASVIQPISSQVTTFSTQWTKVTGNPPVTNVATLAPLYDALGVVQWAVNGAKSTSGSALESYIDGQGAYNGVLGTYTFTSSYRGLMTNQAGTAQAGTFKDGVFNGVK